MTVRKNLLYCVFSKFDQRKTRNDDILRSFARQVLKITYLLGVATRLAIGLPFNGAQNARKSIC